MTKRDPEIVEAILAATPTRRDLRTGTVHLITLRMAGSGRRVSEATVHNYLLELVEEGRVDAVPRPYASDWHNYCRQLAPHDRSSG
jgi:hypothetical protein